MTSSSTSWATGATGTTRAMSRRTRSRRCTPTIAEHPSVRELYQAQLVDGGVIDEG